LLSGVPCLLYLLANNYLELAPELEAFSAYTEDGILDWEDIKSAVSDSYYNTSDAPANVSALKADESALFTVDLHGVMSDAKRTIKLRKSNLEKALLQFEENNSEILYPIGSTFVADHQLDGQTKETTVMRKLDSGYWAYWVYDDQGNLALKTNSSPRKLKAPTQCIGCHMGQKQFEPSSSFPRLLEDKERRKRQIYTSSQLRNLSPRLDEHQKRSDSVLGPYGAIYIAQLRSSSESLSEKEKELLDSFSSN